MKPKQLQQKPKSEWRRRRISSFSVLQTSTIETEEIVCNQSEQKDDGLADEPTDFHNSVILDSGSTIKDGTCKNPALLGKLRKSRKPIIQNTNLASKRLDTEGDMGNLTMYCDEKQMANIISQCHLSDKYHNVYDNWVRDGYDVYTEDGVVEFNWTIEGLYAYKLFKKYFNLVAKLREKPSSEMSHLVSTVKENRKGYTPRQFERAKVARKLLHVLGCPTAEKLKLMLKQNLVRNCPVTAEDVNLAEQIFGLDMGALKGKTTRSKPTPVIEDRNSRRIIGTKPRPSPLS